MREAIGKKFVLGDLIKLKLYIKNKINVKEINKIKVLL